MGVGDTGGGEVGSIAYSNRLPTDSTATATDGAKYSRRFGILLVAVIVGLGVVVGAGAGDAGGAGPSTLDAQSSAVSLSACEPITTSGTYQLTDDITNESGETCLDIRASDVTIDGQGHTIDMQGAGDAVNISATGSISNVTIANLEVHNTTTAVSARVPAGESLTGVTIHNLATRKMVHSSNNAAVDIVVQNGGSLADVAVRESELYTDSNGVTVSANANDTTVTDLRVQDNVIGENASNAGDTDEGIRLDIDGATGASVSGVVVTGNGINASEEGLVIDGEAPNGAPVEDVYIAGNNISQSGMDGIRFQMGDANYRGPLSNVTIHDNLLVENGDDAISINADEDDMRADNLSITHNTIRRATDNGLDIDLGGDGAIVSALTIEKNVIENVTDVGVELQTDGEFAMVDGVAIHENEISVQDGGTAYGIDFDAAGDEMTLGTAITGNTITATDHAVNVDLSADTDDAREFYAINISGNNLTATGAADPIHGINLNPTSDNAVLDLSVTDNHVDAKDDAIQVETEDAGEGMNQTLIVDIHGNYLTGLDDGIDFDGEGDDTTLSFSATNNSVDAPEDNAIDLIMDGENQSNFVDIRHNTLSANGDALTLEADSNENVSLNLGVTDNTFNASSTNIDLEAGTDNASVTATITDNVFEGDDGVDFDLDGANASNGVEIRRNTVDLHGDAIDIEADDDYVEFDLAVIDNHFERVDDWIYVDSGFDENITSHVTVRDNYVNATGIGIEVLADSPNSTATVSVTNNTIANVDHFIDPIDVAGENQESAVIIRRNEVTAMDDGMLIDADAANVTSTLAITNNTFHRVATGMELWMAGDDANATVFIADNYANTTDTGVELTANNPDMDILVSATRNTFVGDSSSAFATGFDMELDGSNESVEAAIANNTIQDMADGVVLDIDGTNSTVDTQIVENTIANATIGVDLTLDGDNETVDLVVGSNVINASTAGVRVDSQLLDAAAVDATVWENNISSVSGTGIEIETPNGTAPVNGTLSIVRNRLDTGSGDAIFKDSGPVAGIQIHGNELLTVAHGVNNTNTTPGVYLNATHNYWGASTGPGSAGTYEDPVTGGLANGSGSTVTEGGTTGVANVQFEPFQENGTGTPRAVLSADRSSTVAGGPAVTFDAGASTDVDGQIVEYRWDVDGDGTIEESTTDVAFTYQYQTAGTYDAAVTVVDDDGLMDTTTVSVTVLDEIDGDLVVSPTTADVNVSTVALQVTNVAGSSTPASFEWDLDGDGTIDDTTTDNETSHVYTQLHGSVTPSVDVYDDQGRFLFTADTALTVTDRVAPVVQAAAPSEVNEGEAFTVDLAGSSDNDRLSEFTITTDGGTMRTVAGDTTSVELSLGSSGQHSVTVAASDRSGNTNSTTLQVTATSPPDLVASLAVNESLVLDREAATANVTVRNDGETTVSEADVALDVGSGSVYWEYRQQAMTTTQTVTDLAPGETETLTFDFTNWAETHVSDSRPRVQLTATADPDDTVAESNETNNEAVAETEIGSTNLVATVDVPSRSLATTDETVDLYFVNDGTVPSIPHTATVDFGDGTNTTVQVPALAGGARKHLTVNHTFATGTNTVAVNVTTDPTSAGNEDDATTRTADEYELTLVDVVTPSEVETNDTFYVRTPVRDNYAANKNYTLELPAGLERVGGEQLTTTATTGTPAWEVRAVDPGTYQLNGSVAARGETANRTGTVRVVTPTVRVTNTTSLSPNGTTTTAITVRPETTYEHTLTVDTQLGSPGRTLSGLQYLFDYPHYCVEQTTSPMLAALNTDKYYRTGGRSAPDSYDQDRTDGAVQTGMQSLTQGSNAQHDNGAWSMYGNDPDGDMYYTAYALYGSSGVANDDDRYATQAPIQANLAAADFNQTVFWFEANQQADGRLANDKFYFEDDYAMTGFVLVALDRAAPYNDSAAAAADRVRADAAQFLVDTQNADGSWGNGDANGMSTAVAVWGLAESNVSTPAVQQALDDGQAWLLDNQEADGAWTETRSSSWRDTGTTSETTGYALQALTATGLTLDNDSVTSGVDYLVQTYDEDGSFGHTRASAVAIKTLMTVTEGNDVPERTLDITLESPAGTTITKTVSVNDTNAQVTIDLTEQELETLRDDASPGNTVVEVTVDSTGDGTVVVGIENEQVVHEAEYDSNTGGN